jgi:glucose-1-phosphate adenylyltransferase
VYAHEFTGFMQVINSMNAYFEANMALMLPQVRAQLFCPDRPIYTKVRDDMPARYGLGCHVTNSLVADGCQVDGEVHNCVLFRGVKVAKGARLENCVIMQDSIIGRGSRLNYVVIDKDVEIKEERSLMGFQSYPVFISKGSIV